ncbi:MAG: response regulator [Myxococcota bacterium]|nr:response regulator [Myxococcales bacterium]
MDRDARPRVLLVEDEAILRRNLARLLERRGHDVLAVASIGEARALLREGTVDAAVLDVGLPDGDGLDLLPETGASHSLVISAEVDDGRLDASGVAHFLRKPLELAAFARCVEGLVHGDRAA